MRTPCAESFRKAHAETSAVFNCSCIAGVLRGVRYANDKRFQSDTT
jgi:hypothetical protein